MPSVGFSGVPGDFCVSAGWHEADLHSQAQQSGIWPDRPKTPGTGSDAEDTKDAGARRPPHVVCAFSWSPSVGSKPHGRRDESAPHGSCALRPWFGTSGRRWTSHSPASGPGQPASSAPWSRRAPICCMSTHGVSAPWAGNAHRVVSSSEPRRPRRLVTGRSARTGRVGRWWCIPAGTHPGVALTVTTSVPGTARVGDADPTPSHVDGPGRRTRASHGSEQPVPRRAVRPGDRRRPRCSCAPAPRDRGRRAVAEGECRRTARGNDRGDRPRQPRYRPPGTGAGAGSGNRRCTTRYGADDGTPPIARCTGTMTAPRVHWRQLAPVRRD